MAAVVESPSLQGAGNEEPQADADGRRTRLLLLSVLSGGLLWLSYFPLSWGPVAWFALVPFLGLVRAQRRPRVVYWLAYLTGMVFYVPVLHWLRVADPRMYWTWFGLAIYCSLYFPISLFIVRYLDRRTRFPLVVTFPVVWTALEFFRSDFGGGFPWYLLAHSQHDALQLIQFSDVTGAWGVSILVALVNAVLFEILFHSRRFREACAAGEYAPRWGARGLVAVAAVPAVLIAAALVYGVKRLDEPMKAGPRVAMVQGNVAQQLRIQRANADDPNNPSAIQAIKDHYFNLAYHASSWGPDLIVWPETSFPYDWEDMGEPPPVDSTDLDAQEVLRRRTVRALAGSSLGLDVLGRNRLITTQLAGIWRTASLLGFNSTFQRFGARRTRYNSAMLIDRTGEQAGIYHKIHRVPFGEYVPFRETLPWVESLSPYEFDYSIAPGTEHTRFPLEADGFDRPLRFGVIICYEDTDPFVTRPYAGSDGLPPVDFLVNISNDGWFDGTSEHQQHLAICRFRAIENRASVVRAVNMGISAVIDGSGRVLPPQPAPHLTHVGVFGTNPHLGPLAGPAWGYLKMLEVWHPPVWTIQPTGESFPVSEWSKHKKVPGVYLATVPLDERGSLYSRWGDWLPWGCWALVGVMVLSGFVGIARRP